MLNVAKNEPKSYFYRGVAYGQQGKTDLAIADFSQAIKINPLYADAYLHRGNRYDDRNKIVQAITDYNQAIKINNKYGKAYLARALANMKNGNKLEAIKDLETAKQLFQQQNDTKGYQIVQEFLNKL
ncbi:tetratricopeptide repeat protein [Sphaerospermopsis torques-reginae]|uniref:tetratricopeptide repeat protein n=1 Tax=Sphaerospermopsis torques-reginae TaxID=984207 RepID=UPI00349EE191